MRLTLNSSRLPKDSAKSHWTRRHTAMEQFWAGGGGLGKLGQSPPHAPPRPPAPGRGRC